MINKIKNILLKNKRLIILFICLVVFIKFTEEVFFNEIIKTDAVAYKYVVEKLRTDSLTKIMKVITFFGDAISIITLTILSIIFVKNKNNKIFIGVNAVLITLLNLLIKNLVKRPRPEGFRIISESGYSFPSGHSMVSTAFYGLFIYLAYKYINNKKLKYFICISLSILIVLIGTSRVYLGVHYGSDVIAGFVLSVAYLIGFTSIFSKILED